MPVTIQIALTREGRCEPLFPDRCVACGDPPASDTTFAVSRTITRKRKQSQLKVTLEVPHCRRCARISRAIDDTGLWTTIVGFLVIGALVFVAVVYGAWIVGLDDSTQSSTTTPSLVLGAFFGLLAGIAGAALFEGLARLLMLPFYGATVLRAPLFAAQFLADTSYTAGLTGKLDPKGERLELTFENVSVAEAFAHANGVPTMPSAGR